jgi:outer membrane protein assembly factor BamA
MKRTLFLLLSFSALLSTGLPAFTQEFTPKTIEFKGDPEYSDQELLAASGLKPGIPLTQAEMRDHAQKLMDSGVFDNLTFKWDGQNLVYTLTPSTALLPIRLVNLPFALDKDLDAELRERIPLYHGKVPPEGGLMDRVRETLEERLAAKGIQAALDATPFTDQSLHKVTAMNFAITSPPVQIGEIRLDAASAALDPKAQEILARFAGSAFDTEGSQSQIETYLGAFYRDRGYLEAEVHAAPQAAPINTPDAVLVPFLISVSPGALYKLAGVQLAPDMLVTQAEFDRQSHIHPGDIADGAHVRENWEFIARQYHNNGYIKAKVQPTASFDRAQGKVGFAVTVEPGLAYKMGKLTIENASDDLRAAMLAAWGMPAGAVFNEGMIRGFFATTSVHPALERVFATLDFSYVLLPNDDARTVDVVLRLEKKH